MWKLTTGLGPYPIDGAVVVRSQKSTGDPLEHIILVLIDFKVSIDELGRPHPKMFRNPFDVGIGEQGTCGLAAVGAIQAVRPAEFLGVQFPHHIVKVLGWFLCKFGKKIPVLRILFPSLLGQFFKIVHHTGSKIIQFGAYPAIKIRPLYKLYPMTDLFGKAMMDYWREGHTEDIKTFSSLAGEDVIPLPYLFRDFGQMPEVEQRALELAKGKVLDIGCGAGSHALYLQEKGLEVTALDSSKGCIEVCRERGVRSTVISPILDYGKDTFDTLLLPMNGIGLAGTLEDLGPFLRHLTSLLRPGGQLLLDSSDIIYMFEQDEDGGYWIPGDIPYYGEVVFTMEYKDLRRGPFPWIYVDFNTLHNMCSAQGLDCELVLEGEHFDYLAKLSI